jgi:hypothetical protein
MKMQAFLQMTNVINKLSTKPIDPSTWPISLVLKVKRIASACKAPIESYQEVVKEIGSSTGYDQYIKARDAHINEFGIQDANGNKHIPGDSPEFAGFLVFLNDLNKKHEESLKYFESGMTELLASEVDIELPATKLTTADLEHSGLNAQELMFLDPVADWGNE